MSRQWLSIFAHMLLMMPAGNSVNKKLPLAMSLPLAFASIWYLLEKLSSQTFSMENQIPTFSFQHLVASISQ